jgi:hypothetical protein
MPRKRFARTALALAVAGLAAVPGAALATPSGYDQYVPFMPSSTGPTAPGGHHGHGGGTGGAGGAGGTGSSVPLTPAVASALRGVDPGTRALLGQVATSTDLGASALPGSYGSAASATAHGHGGNGAGVSGPGSNSSSNRIGTAPSALDAATHQVGQNPALPLIVLAALGTALLVAVMRRRRSAQ